MRPNGEFAKALIFYSCKAEDVPNGFDAMGCHVATHCPILPSLYSVSSSKWAVPELVDRTSGGPWPPAEPGEPGYVPLQPGAEVSGLGMHSTNHNPNLPPAPELLPSGAVSGVVAMNLSAFEGFDIVPGDIPGLGVEGVLWTQTRAVAGIPHTAFRPWANWYRAAFFGRSSADVPDPEQLPQTSCGPLCEMSCKVCNMLDEIANLVLSRINPVDFRLFAVTRHGTEDMTDNLSVSVRSALTDADLQWLNAAEHGPWQGSNTPLFAAVTSDMSSVPLVAAYRNGKVVPAGRLLDDEVPFEAMGIPESPVQLSAVPDSGRTEAAAVLSATEKALFVVGGRTQDGWAETLRIYHTRGGTWGEMPLDGELPRKVLTATYHPLDRSIYVIDEIGGSSSKGRLLRVDLETAKVSLLGIWPRQPWNDRVYLTLGTDGTLLLVGSSSKHRRHVAVSVNVVDRKHPAIEWGYLGRGHVALSPTLGDRGLTLPLAVGGRIENEFVPLRHLGSHKVPHLGHCL